MEPKKNTAPSEEGGEGEGEGGVKEEEKGQTQNVQSLTRRFQQGAAVLAGMFRSCVDEDG